MRKRALVISGGGSRGAFAVGAVKALVQQFPQINFDIYVGTSTGSLIAPLAAAGNIALLEQMYTTIHTNDVVLGGNIGARLTQSISLFDATPLSNLINKYYNDTVATGIMNLNKQIYMTTVCLQTGESVIFSNKPPLANSDYDIVKCKNTTIFRRAVLASCCQPAFMQPIEIDITANPVRQYVDGGVREYAGVQIAVDAGAEEIFAISLKAFDNSAETKKYTSAIDILFKTIDIFSADVGANDFKVPEVYNSALQYIDGVKKKMIAAGVTQQKIDEYFNVASQPAYAGKKPLRIHHIYPEAPLGGGAGGLVFDPAEMKAMLAKGEIRMERYIASLPPDNSNWV